MTPESLPTVAMDRAEIALLWQQYIASTSRPPRNEPWLVRAAWWLVRVARRFQKPVARLQQAPVAVYTFPDETPIDDYDAWYEVAGR